MQLCCFQIVSNRLATAINCMALRMTDECLQNSPNNNSKLAGMAFHKNERPLPQPLQLQI